MARLGSAAAGPARVWIVDQIRVAPKQPSAAPVAFPCISGGGGGGNMEISAFGKKCGQEELNM